jgi:hypothetical protein
VAKCLKAGIDVSVDRAVSQRGIVMDPSLEEEVLLLAVAPDEDEGESR